MTSRPLKVALSTASLLIAVIAGIVVIRGPVTADEVESTIPVAAPSGAVTEWLEEEGLRWKVIGSNPADVQEAAPAVEGKRAVEVAMSMAGSSTADVSSATLVLATSLHQGTEKEPDPSKESRIDPALDQALVWLVVVKHAEQIIFGGLEYEGPATVPSTMAALVDASTGHLVQVMYIGDDPVK